jgi:hypothetical protein
MRVEVISNCSNGNASDQASSWCPDSEIRLSSGSLESGPCFDYMISRGSCSREIMMKNVTISMDKALAQRIRVAAARAGQSVSRYLAEAGRRRVEEEESGADRIKRNRQREALERILAGPKWDVTIDGRMPTADERNARK